MSTVTAVPTSWVGAWHDALTVLELDVAQAEAQLAVARSSAPDLTSPRPWAPALGLGPLPASLQTRAQALLDRQIGVGRRIAEAANLSRRQAVAAEGMRSRLPAVPVYIDTEG